MIRAAKVDANQRAIVGALRSIGASCQLLHQVGGGCPDVLVGFRGQNVLLELKDGDKPPSARKLTPAQVVFHASWQGQVATVESPEQAIAAVMTLTRARDE